MLIIDILITVAPLIGYYSQYSLMLENKTVGTFSIDICLILIVANVLRIFFWFASGFANNLLLQSFLILGMQFLLLDLCVKLGYKSKGKQQTQGFWRWNTLQPFISFTVLLAAIIAVVTIGFVFVDIKIYGTILGLLSLSIEATLGFPQLITNQRSRNVEGLSIFMVVTWFLGDFFKTIYFVVQNQPFQFIISGAVQLSVDTLILIQIMAFKQTTKPYRNVKQDHHQYVDNQHQTTIDDSRIQYDHQLVKNTDDDDDVHGI